MFRFLIALPAVMAAATDIQPAFDIGERFIGRWQLALETDTATFGERGSAGQGSMTCEHGPEKAWVDCVMQASYDSTGDYSLKIVLFKTSESSRIGAFVTNSWGGGRLYHGTLPHADRLVFEDAYDDTSRKWRYQRTTYVFDKTDGIRFAIDVSNDGQTYLPHSGGTYQRVRYETAEP